MFNTIQSISCNGNTFEGAELTRPFFIRKREHGISMTNIEAIAEIMVTKHGLSIKILNKYISFMINGKPIEGFWHRIKVKELEIFIIDKIDDYSDTYIISVKWTNIIKKNIYIIMTLGFLITMYSIYNFVIIKLLSNNDIKIIEQKFLETKDKEFKKIFPKLTVKQIEVDKNWNSVLGTGSAHIEKSLDKLKCVYVVDFEYQKTNNKKQPILFRIGDIQVESVKN